jgi:hypothetical protein
MPVFVCVPSESDYLPVEHDGAFALRDARGRDWICYPSTRATLLTQASPADQQLLAALRRCPSSRSGWGLAEVECADERVLGRVLADLGRSSPAA